MLRNKVSLHRSQPLIREALRAETLALDDGGMIHHSASFGNYIQNSGALQVATGKLQVILPELFCLSDLKPSGGLTFSSGLLKRITD